MSDRGVADSLIPASSLTAAPTAQPPATRTPPLPRTTPRPRATPGASPGRQADLLRQLLRRIRMHHHRLLRALQPRMPLMVYPPPRLPPRVLLSDPRGLLLLDVVHTQT